VETTDENECLAFGLPQRVLEFVCAIANVEVDEDGADFGSGKLREHPFGAVRGPNPNAIALLDANGYKGASESFDFQMKIRPGQSLVLVASHKSAAGGKRSGSAIEHISDADMQQGRF
jgi:hypothetical protein